MKNILIINTAGMGLGGITTHMQAYIQELKKTSGDELQFTIGVTGKKDERMIEKFEELLCHMIYLPDRRTQTLNYRKAVKQLMLENKYDVLHVHGNSSTMLLELNIGKKYHVPVRIAHCHNSRCDHPVINRLLKPVFRTTYTNALACSQLAGNWLFGENQFQVLHNAIDVEKYCFREEVRAEYRKKLKLDDDVFLVGHVGGFNEQKNHEFLIQIFCEIEKRRKAELVLIGTGALENKIRGEVERLPIKDRVHFLGVRDDVNCWMQAMDVFLFPSRWEGLGIVLIEAQAAGLPVIASSVVPRDVIVSDKIQFLCLEESPEYWAGIAAEYDKKHTDRKISSEAFLSYDIRTEKNVLYEIYAGENKNRLEQENVKSEV